jgi:tetratricopeptide (TPR) repeat protein
MKSFELFPNHISTHRLLSLAYHGKGMYEEAAIENEKWGELSGDKIDSSAGLALIYASSGKKAEAMKLLEDLSIDNEFGGSTCRGIALAYSALGEKDSAFGWLEKAYEKTGESLCTLKIDPKLDPLREDPRFKLLLERIGL